MLVIVGSHATRGQSIECIVAKLKLAMPSWLESRTTKGTGQRCSILSRASHLMECNCLLASS
jgi:hypothetical protein